MKPFQIVVGTIFGCLLVASLCPTAWGQGQLRTFLSMQDGNLLSLLLQQDEVRSELNLSDNQSEACRELATKIGAAFREELSDLSDADEQEYRSMQSDIEAELHEEEMETLNGLLNEQQLHRLRQLLLQRRGALALLEDPVAEAVKLNPQQREQVKQAIEENHESLAKTIEKLVEGGRFQEIFDARTAGRKRLDAAVMAMLDDGQQGRLAELKGALFQFPERRRQRRNDF